MTPRLGPLSPSVASPRWRCNREDCAERSRVVPGSGVARFFRRSPSGFRSDGHQRLLHHVFNAASALNAKQRGGVAYRLKWFRHIIQRPRSHRLCSLPKRGFELSRGAPKFFPLVLDSGQGSFA